MLSRDSLEVSIPLASVLDNHNLGLVPVAGSPLEILVNATRFDLSNSNNNGDGTFTPDLGAIDYIANVKDPVLNICKHDVALDDITEVVSKAVKDHMNFAKSVVAPAVEELVNKTNEALAQLKPSVLLGMEVVTYYPPKPLLNTSLEEAVRAFNEVAMDNPPLNLRLPSITANEVIELMKSGSGNLDSAISEWASIKGDVFFISLWENLFQQKQAELSDRTVTTFNDYIYKNSNDIDNALAIFLLARKLKDNPLPDTEMNLNTFNSTIVEFRNQAGYRLCRTFDDIAKTDKLQLLVREMNDRVITVNGNIYSKWIEKGGENEVLFGNLLIKPGETTVSAIDAKAEEFKAKWTHYATLTATVERNRLFSRTKEILFDKFQEQMRVIVEGDEATVGNREMIIKKFGETLDTVREDELTNLWDVCLKLVCVSRFSNTEARRILLGIERVKKENPSISVRESAAISILEYISYWLSTQMVCKAI